MFCVWEDVAMGIEIRKLGGPMLAEVVGVDPSEEIAPDDRAKINRAFLDNLVLVFRDSMMDVDAFVRFAGIFGELQPHPTRSYWHPKYDEVLVLTNQDKEGRFSEYDNKRGVGWHTDMCFVEVPPKATILHTIRIPEVGGDTLFANMYLAYEYVPKHLREAIDGRMAQYRVGGRTKVGQSRLAANERGDEYVVHPAVRVHPETGRKSIYVNPIHTLALEGMPEDESNALIDEIGIWYDNCSDIQARHKWRLGDTVIWDNRCALHAATGDNPLRQPREFFRTTVRGTPTH